MNHLDELQPGATAARAAIAITLDAATPAGIYPLWLASPTGISNPVLLGVDAIPQRVGQRAALQAAARQLGIVRAGDHQHPHAHVATCLVR